MATMWKGPRGEAATATARAAKYLNSQRVKGREGE
jgi:hypothetical protein